MNEKTKVQPSIDMKDYMTIKQIMNEFNLTHVYVSRAVQKGWLKPVEKIRINNKGNQFKYVVKRTVVMAWRKRCDSKARRTDGRRKYNLYGTQKEIEQFLAWKKEHNIEMPTKLANPGKDS